MKKIYILFGTILMTFSTQAQTNIDKPVFTNQLEKTATPLLFFPGTVSQRDVVHFGSSFSEDGKHLVYTMTSKGKPGSIVIQSFDKDMFSPPVPIEQDTLNSYSDASISLDGNTITLSSNRPQNIEGREDVGNGLWQFQRKEGWGNPKFLNLEMDYVGGFSFPTTTKNNTLYFAYMPDDGTRNMDIFSSKLINGTYEKPIKLPAHINSGKFEGDPFIDSQERFVIFAGFDRTENYGRSDLYITFKLEEGWSNVINLGATINSHGYDGSPYVTIDDEYLIFTSSRHPENEGEEEFFNLFYVLFDLPFYQSKITD